MCSGIAGGGGGGAQAPDLFEDGPFTSQIYVLYILICSPSTTHPSVRDEKQSALLAVVDYYVFIPLNKALNPCFMFWILK